MKIITLLLQIKQIFPILTVSSQCDTDLTEGWRIYGLFAIWKRTLGTELDLFGVMLFSSIVLSQQLWTCPVLRSAGSRQPGQPTPGRSGPGDSAPRPPQWAAGNTRIPERESLRWAHADDTCGCFVVFDSLCEYDEHAWVNTLRKQDMSFQAER